MSRSLRQRCVEAADVRFQAARNDGQTVENPQVKRTRGGPRHGNDFSSMAPLRFTADPAASHSLAGKMRELVEMVADNLRASALELTGAESVRPSIRDEEEEDGLRSNAALLGLDDELRRQHSGDGRTDGY